MRSDTLYRVFQESCVKFPQRTFLQKFGEPPASYESALVRVAGVVVRLEKQGLKKSDFLICYSERTDSVVYIILACAVMGVAFVPISPLFSIEFAKTVAKKIGTKWFYCEPENVDRFNDSQSTVILQEAQVHSALTATEAHKIVERFGQHIGPTDILELQLTSGSTGEPKLAVRDQFSFVRDARVWFEWSKPLELAAYNFLFVSALTHAFGVLNLTTSIVTSGTLMLPSAVDTAAPINEVRALDPTIIPLTPRVVRSFYQQAGAPGPTGDRIFGPSARLLYTIGGLNDLSAIHGVRSQGLLVADLYGMAEVGLVTMSPIGGWKENNVGLPFPDVARKLSEDGEILARTPITCCYFGNEALTKEAITDDGFYRTGDLGEIDADGCLKIIGRKKDVFLTFEGSNVSPVRIEIMMESRKWVEQACLVGDGKPFFSALIVIRGDKPLSLEPDGYLDPRKAHEIYEMAAKDLQQVNNQLEIVERVQRFALFVAPFDITAYKIVGGAKVSRNRKNISKLYMQRIQELYESAHDVQLVKS